MTRQKVRIKIMEECLICERIKDVKRIGNNRSNITFKVALVEDSNRDGIFQGRLTHRAPLPQPYYREKGEKHE